ncbi:MAG: YMGG-like glycine zipper-containing protein [Pirellulales bacterium]
MTTRRDVGFLMLAAAWLVALAGGCNSPYRADRGALFGGLTGAGLGAVVGNAVGDTGAGAAIGAGVGALSGAAVGASLDDIEARNRAEIAARLGRPAPVGAVSIDDVIAMSRAGVPEEVIVTHVQNHGMMAPPRATDLILLQQQGVAPRVVQAMQAPPQVVPAAYPPGVIAEPAYAVPAPVYYAPPPYWGPPPCYYRPYPRRRVSWGVAVGG